MHLDRAQAHLQDSCANSLFVRPSAASIAVRSSAAVSAATPAVPDDRGGRPPEADSSIRARPASSAQPHRSASSSAERSARRAGTRRLARPSAVP